ncbi:hypothetical protein [Texcoconibacillus texcoconensis]|uniref:Uncharacterized protein n=1 Tax=Texcoconibacillus texcoconensis TaxID=1095777 RepID=A0A840QTT9_9BACI|nr:hypothetical protein [Texcoconibacillus texcoconensis]MBB5174708.1 hypothetical protein [Texcoconibacillus texcoconensis]
MKFMSENEQFMMKVGFITHLPEANISYNPATMLTMSVNSYYYLTLAV